MVKWLALLISVKFYIIKFKIILLEYTSKKIKSVQLNCKIKYIVSVYCIPTMKFVSEVKFKLYWK